MHPTNEQLILNHLECIQGRLSLIHERLTKIMATQAELTAQVAAATDKLKKIGTETASLLKKIDDLTAIIAAGPPPSQELQDAIAALTEQAKVVDDLVPDATP